jgi:hypothetical protein
MLYPTTPDSLRRRRLIVAGTGVALVAIVFLTSAVLVHRQTATPPRPPHPDRAGSTRIAVQQGQQEQPPAVALPALQPTVDPQAFARLVARALFTWDTSSMVGRGDHVERLLAVADPTGASTPGLLSDLDNYLPTHDAWVDLARYQTRQWLSIDSVATPSLWSHAEAQAGSALLPGTEAFTIHGDRHRFGVWEGTPVTTAHEVAFTVFVVCGPSYPTCHLLRLSMLDKPLA